MWGETLATILLALGIIFGFLYLINRVSDLTEDLGLKKSISESLKQENNNLKNVIATLKRELEELKNSQHLIDQAADKAEADKLEKRRTEIIQAIARSAITSAELDLLYEGIENGRLINAFADNLSIIDLDITAKIPSATEFGKIYQTSLTTCDCPDRKKHNYPCKHSLFLAYSLGVLQIYPTYIENKYVHTLDEYNLKIKEKLDIEEKIRKAKKRYDALTQSNKRLEKYQNKFNQIIDRIITDRCSAYPHIAGIIADLETMHYKETAEYLENKQHPAKTEAKRIKELRTETQRIALERNELKYKLDYLKNLYPNIEDVFDDGFNQELVFELETEETTDRTRLYLSHEEYSALSVAERNQLALDRYIENRKTKWQIGRDYEMYIGYTLEQQGYSVKYTGILENLEDMGRDLIIERNNVVQIVQCKNWSQEKTIHEKHIFQLYGSVILYRIDHPNLCVNGVFITTTSISDKAKKIASHLGIIVEENVPIGSFPRIKCNINRQTGEKIYHLPFDQQYDKTVIETKHNEFMAFTVKEAEEAGFRRAFKHFA